MRQRERDRQRENAQPLFIHNESYISVHFLSCQDLVATEQAVRCHHLKTGECESAGVQVSRKCNLVEEGVNLH